jgi:hypothetical protein
MACGMPSSDTIIKPYRPESQVGHDPVDHNLNPGKTGHIHNSIAPIYHCGTRSRNKPIRNKHAHVLRLDDFLKCQKTSHVENNGGPRPIQAVLHGLENDQKEILL